MTSTTIRMQMLEAVRLALVGACSDGPLASETPQKTRPETWYLTRYVSRSTRKYLLSWLTVAVMFPLALLGGEKPEPVRAKALIEVKVIVLNYDPIVTKADGTKIRLHEECRWLDPRKLVEGYIADLDKAAAGTVSLKVVEWKDIDRIPRKKDGFEYTTESYLKCHHDHKGWHAPDAVDYAHAVAENGIVELIDKGAVDEVWLFGGPYFGYWESAMAGPRSFYINGGPLRATESKRPFAIMGFNYERGVAEMLHSLCHRIESTMGRFSGGWKADVMASDWARFAANAKQSKGEAGCGSCHFPPNAEADYDYANKRVVLSSADDWLNYPKLTGAKTEVTCETWGGPDYQRNYFVWWYSRFPRAAGTNPDSGLQNNWWHYVYSYDQYLANGRPRDAAK